MICDGCGSSIAGGGYKLYHSADDTATVCSYACASGVAQRRFRRGSDLRGSGSFPRRDSYDDALLSVETERARGTRE